MLELPEIYAENIHLWLPELLYYSLTTLKIGIVSFVLAVAIGIVFALWRTSRFALLRAFATAYIEAA
jgi:ABC-type amino acid transport system permease subunit